MKLRILNVLTKTAPTIPQTPHTDLKYPYVPKMAIRPHCALILVTSFLTDGHKLSHLLDGIKVKDSSLSSESGLHEPADIKEAGKGCHHAKLSLLSSGHLPVL